MRRLPWNSRYNHLPPTLDDEIMRANSPFTKDLSAILIPGRNIGLKNDHTASVCTPTRGTPKKCLRVHGVLGQTAATARRRLQAKDGSGDRLPMAYARIQHAYPCLGAVREAAPRPGLPGPLGR